VTNLDHITEQLTSDGVVHPEKKQDFKEKLLEHLQMAGIVGLEILSLPFHKIERDEQ
jgi:hypothetical protein